MPDHVNRPPTARTAPAARTARTARTAPAAMPPPLSFAAPHHAGPAAAVAATGEDGSLVSEYGLIAVLGATITGLAISWAKGGAIATLLNVILRQVRALAGV